MSFWNMKFELEERATYMNNWPISPLKPIKSWMREHLEDTAWGR